MKAVYENAGSVPLPNRTKTIKLDVRTWDSLKSIKKENETFNDVINELLKERTRAIGDKNIKAIKYHRKTHIFTLAFGKGISVEYEYNDVKSIKSEFTLDIKIKRIFFGRKTFSSSGFFGVDNTHKHYSDFFLFVYFEAVTKTFLKEFRVYYGGMDYFSLAHWRKLYYDYNLSEESFKSDIEEPLRLSEEEKPQKAWLRKVSGSTANKFIKDFKITFR